jgi:hypothetical protein
MSAAFGGERIPNGQPHTWRPESPAEMLVERIGLPSTEDHAEGDRRTLAELSAFRRNSKTSLRRGDSAALHSFTVSVSMCGFGCKRLILGLFWASQFHSRFWRRSR